MLQFDNRPRPEVIKEERPPEPCLRALRRESDDNPRRMETVIITERLGWINAVIYEPVI
jgi:hypothetical protein